MRQIEFPGKGFNVEEIARFASDLKTNFMPVRVRFYKATFKTSGAVKPITVFHAEPAKANYVTIHIKSREAIEFYRKLDSSGGYLFDENLSDENVRVVLNTLLKHRMRNIPAPKIQVVPTMPVQQQEPFFSKLFGIIQNLFSSLRSRL